MKILAGNRLKKKILCFLLTAMAVLCSCCYGSPVSAEEKTDTKESPAYYVDIPDVEHGYLSDADPEHVINHGSRIIHNEIKLSGSRSSYGAGEAVLIEISADAGCRLNNIYVFDDTGNEVDYTLNGNNTNLRFVMPQSDVMISPVFVDETYLPEGAYFDEEDYLQADAEPDPNGPEQSQVLLKDESTDAGEDMKSDDGEGANADAAQADKQDSETDEDRKEPEEPGAEIKSVKSAVRAPRLAAKSEAGSKTLAEYFNIRAVDVINNLKSHEYDNFYLGTPYKYSTTSVTGTSDWRNPNGDPSAHGLNRYNKAGGGMTGNTGPGMQCTGFVWYVLVAAKANPYSVPHLAARPQGTEPWNSKGWYTFTLRENIKRYQFGSKEEMLASGILQKGDIVMSYDSRTGGAGSISNDHHIGFFWGDRSNEDKYWHSGPKVDGDKSTEVNTISAINRKTVYANDFWVYKLGVSTGTFSIGKKGAATNEQISGATYYVYADAACTRFANDVNGSHTLITTNGTPPNASNILTYPAGTYYIREAENVPDGTVVNTKVYQVNVEAGKHVYPVAGWLTNEEYGYGAIVKRSSLDDTILADAEYTVYTDQACTKVAKTVAVTDKTPYQPGNYPCTDAILKTTAAGSNILHLTPGTYYVRETKAPSGYAKDSTVHTMQIRRAGRTVLTAYNNPLISVNVIKKSANPDLTAQNLCYSLKNAEYGVYASQDDAKNDKNRIQTLTTDETGVTNSVQLEYDPNGNAQKNTYYIRECKASAGFLMCDGIGNDGSYDNGIHPITLNADQKQTQSVYCTEIPATDAFHLRIRKKDADTGEALARGITSLEGGIFELSYFMNTEGNTDGTPSKVWYFRTDENGCLFFNNPEYLLENYIMHDKKQLTSGALEKDSDGNVFYPLGTYQVREISSPKYFQLSGTMNYINRPTEKKKVTEGMTAVIRQDKNGKQPGIFDGEHIIQGAIASENLTIDVYDLVRRGSIRLIKKADDGSDRPVAGASYRLVGLEQGDEHIGITDANGEMVWEQLIPQNYLVTEIETPEGFHLLKDQIEIRIPLEMSEEEMDASLADRTKAVYDEVSGKYGFYDMSYDIRETRNLKLPLTGGDEKKMILILGASFAMGAAGIALWLKRNNDSGERA